MSMDSSSLVKPTACDRSTAHALSLKGCQNTPAVTLRKSFWLCHLIFGSSEEVELEERITRPTGTDMKQHHQSFEAAGEFQKKLWHFSETIRHKTWRG